MKSTRTPKTPKKAQKQADDLLPEYRFDYRKARPNRFAARTNEGCLTVTLDPELSQVFKTPETVIAVLRALVETMPKTV